MAKILCNYSGLDIKVEHFPLYNQSKESHHPIFDLDISKLLKFQEHWADGKFTNTENYLYYLAVFKATNLVDFRVAAAVTHKTQGIIANNMFQLLQIADKIQYHSSAIAKNILVLPRFVISPETRTLDNTKHWIELWNANYKDYQSGYKTQTHLEQLSRREGVLERLIKDHNKDVAKYAGHLAEWAALAGEFPTYDVLDENDNVIPMSEYWKRLIKYAARGEKIYYVPQIDWQDLIEHCEETIHHGSIFAFELMTTLRAAMKQKTDFLSLGDIDANNTYKILDADASVEDANTISLIMNAPRELPRETSYPSKIAYLRAKMNYDLRKAYIAEHPEFLDWEKGQKEDSDSNGDEASIEASIESIGEGEII